MTTGAGGGREVAPGWGWALVDASPLLVGAWLVTDTLRTWAGRVTYPFDLEWMEGGMLVHALRLLRGQPLYVRPTADWIPYVYPPGYASLLATVSSVTGVDYAPGRALSMVGTLGACAALVAFGWRHGRLAAGAIAACVFLGTYRASGAFFDLVRPDGVAAGLLAWTLVLATDRRRGTAVAAGLLLAATFVVKHHVAAFGLPLALVIWSRESIGRALAFGLSAAVPAGAFALALELRSGHFLDYLLRVPASHPHDWARLFPGAPGEIAAVMLPTVGVAGTFLLARLLGGLPRAVGWGSAAAAAAAGLVTWQAGDAPGVADAPPVVNGLVVGLGAAVAVAVVAHLAGRRGRSDRVAVGASVVGFVVCAVVGVMRSHNGGFANVLIPAHLALSFSLPVAATALRGGPARALFAAAAVAQLSWMAWTLDGDALVPTEEDRAAHAKVLEEVRERCPGEVLSPFAPWLPYQVGREPGFHLIALWDIAHKSNPFRRDVKQIEEAAAAHKWGCVVTAGPKKLGFGVDKAYPVLHNIHLPPRVLVPKTGWRVRPTTLQFPKEE